NDRCRRSGAEHVDRFAAAPAAAGRDRWDARARARRRALEQAGAEAAADRGRQGREHGHVGDLADSRPRGIRRYPGAPDGRLHARLDRPDQVPVSAVSARVWIAACAILLMACGGHATGASDKAVAPAAAVPAGDWPTFDYDSKRSGVGPAGTGINSRNVGRLRTRVVPIDGTVDSSAIELHGI